MTTAFKTLHPFRRLAGLILQRTTIIGFIGVVCCWALIVARLFFVWVSKRMAFVFIRGECDRDHGVTVALTIVLVYFDTGLSGGIASNFHIATEATVGRDGIKLRLISTIVVMVNLYFHTIRLSCDTRSHLGHRPFDRSGVNARARCTAGIGLAI